MNPMLILDVMRFELGRSLTAGRITIWLVLVAFPVGLISILRMKLPIEPIEPIGFAMYFLIPEVVCLLGLLLWATPAIATEIEGQTWIYLAMRRSGRTMVLLGKYLTAVVWSLSAAIVAASLCVLIVFPLRNVPNVVGDVRTCDAVLFLACCDLFVDRCHLSPANDGHRGRLYAGHRVRIVVCPGSRQQIDRELPPPRIAGRLDELGRSSQSCGDRFRQ